MLHSQRRVSEHTVLQRLQQLAEVYRQDQASELMTRTLEKLFLYEAETCHEQLQQLHSDLAQYEHRYGMSSDTFYGRFEQGETDDRMDYVEWASLVQMAQRLEKRLSLLTKKEIA